MSTDIDTTRRNKRPRVLSDHEKEKLDEFQECIHYSNRCDSTFTTTSRPLLLLRLPADSIVRYNNDQYEYRHVQLPKNMLKVIPRDYFDGSRGTLKLLWKDEWRGLGITQVRIPDG